MLIRLLDIVISMISIAIIMPFMIPIMIALKLTGEHYIFYIQPRVGKDSKDFGVLKFATMLKNSPNMPGGVLTQRNDPRILPMGNFLRKTKINELPQLVNIFLGQMSFVGPRPQARRHYDLYSADVKAAIDRIPPGLTGIGSVVFRDEETLLDKIEGDRDDFHDTVIAPYKGALEVWYTHNRTIWNYFLLILLTAFSVVVPENRVYARIFKNLPPIPARLRSFL